MDLIPKRKDVVYARINLFEEKSNSGMFRTQKITPRNNKEYIKDHQRKSSNRKKVVKLLLDQFKKGNPTAKSVEKQLAINNVDTRQPEISWLLRHFESSGTMNYSILDREINLQLDQQNEVSVDTKSFNLYRYVDRKYCPRKAVGKTRNSEYNIINGGPVTAGNGLSRLGYTTMINPSSY